jgi:hypothetical protein
MAIVLFYQRQHIPLPDRTQFYIHLQRRQKKGRPKFPAALSD